jgi:hypothetical protein
MDHTDIPNVHALALIKGSVEGDSYKHFASLFGGDQHAAPLVTAGLLTGNGYDYDATEAGQAFYQEQHLDQLPAGRANNWSALPGVVGAELVANANAALTARL